MNKSLLIAIALCCAALSSAQLTNTSDTSNYVSATGPYTGTHGSTYLDVESYGGGATYAKFGLLDLGFATTSNFNATSISISLTESDTSATFPGTIAFGISTYTGSITSMAYQYGSSDDYTHNGIDPSLYSNGATYYNLGSGAFTSTGKTNTGQVDTYTFSISGAVQSYLKSEVAAGGDVRLVIAANETLTTAAVDGYYTFGGSSATSGAPVVTLSNQAVPEPISMSLLGLGVVGLASRRRK